MKNEMTGTQKFILSLTGLVVLGIGLSKISVAQQKPGPGSFSVIQANEIQLVDSKGTVRMILQAEENESWNGHKFGAIDKGPSVILLKDDGFPGCEINNTSLYIWDTYVSGRRERWYHTKISLGLRHMESPTPGERPAWLYLNESPANGSSGVIIQVRKLPKPEVKVPSKGSNLRVISADAIEVIKGTDKR